MPSSKAKFELELFKAMKWTHLATFIFIILMLTAKQLNFHNLAQTIHALVVCPISILLTLLAIFIVKYNSDSWVGANLITEVRVWMIIDCYFFFAYIISGVIFTTVAYVIKFNPTSKNEELLLMDDNPWNDKDTEDFLRHLKLEFFVFCYFMATLMMDISLGFFKGRDFGAGPKDWNPTQIIFIYDILVKVYNILVMICLSSGKRNINETKTRAALLFLALFDWFMLYMIYSTFRNSNNMAGQNLFARIWIQTLIIGLIIEPIWILSKMYVEQVALDRLIEKMHAQHPEQVDEIMEHQKHGIN